MKHLTPHLTDRIGERAAPYTPLILRIGAVVLALGVGCRTARGDVPHRAPPPLPAVSAPAPSAAASGA
jgi:hypothetical protein